MNDSEKIVAKLEEIIAQQQKLKDKSI